MEKAIVWPVLTMVFLALLVWIRLYLTRIRAIRRQGIKLQNFRVRAALTAAQLPEDALAAADNFQNLFEMPVLFYLLALLLLQLHRVDTLYLVGAWSFVVLRYVHSYIHLTYNRVRHRFYVYFFSCLILWMMWLRFAWQLSQP